MSNPFLNCVLCGEPMPKPLTTLRLLTILRKQDSESQATHFLVHEDCLRKVAHPSAAVDERLDEQL